MSHSSSENRRTPHLVYSSCPTEAAKTVAPHTWFVRQRIAEHFAVLEFWSKPRSYDVVGAGHDLDQLSC